MKHVSLALVALASLGIVFSACKKDDTKEATPAKASPSTEVPAADVPQPDIAAPATTDPAPKQGGDMFVFLTYGFEKPTPEIMSAWSKWMESIKDNTASMGRLSGGREISKAGTKELPMGLESITGFMIVYAKSIDDAMKMAETNPYISSIRVYAKGEAPPGSFAEPTAQKKFVFLTYGFMQPTPKIMEAWGTWMASIKGNIVDMGQLSDGREISKAGTNKLPMGLESITAYMTIAADNLEEAMKMAETNPYISSIRVYELISH